MTYLIWSHAGECTVCLLRNFISNSRDSIEAALILGYHTCFLFLNDGMCLNPSLNFKILRKIKKKHDCIEGSDCQGSVSGRNNRSASFRAKNYIDKAKDVLIRRVAILSRYIGHVNPPVFFYLYIIGFLINNLVHDFGLFLLLSIQSPTLLED